MYEIMALGARADEVLVIAGAILGVARAAVSTQELGYRMQCHIPEGLDRTWFSRRALGPSCARLSTAQLSQRLKAVYAGRPSVVASSVSEHG